MTHIPPVIFLKSLPPIGRLLGIDYGSKQIGLALTDPGRMIATPWLILERGKGRETLETLTKHLKQHTDIVGIVLGYPITLTGQKMPLTQAVEQFARNLHAHTGFAIVFAEERYTTSQAEKMLISADVSRARRSELRDKIAAAALLQAFIDQSVI
jgi:putative holliday junction resolvase